MRQFSLSRGGFLATAAVLNACPAMAQDGGVLMTFGIEQRFETGWNVGLTVPEGGRTSTSATRLSFGLISQTPIDLLEFNASSALLVENSDDTGGTEAELGRPDVNLRYTREVPNALFSIGAQFRRDDVDAFDDDLSEADADGSRTDYGADLRFETGRTAPLGFVFTSGFSRSEYNDTTDPDLVDTDTYRVGVLSLLRFSEVAVGRIGLNYEREEEDGAPGATSEAVTALLGVTYDLSNGSASADLSWTTEDTDGDRVTFEIGRVLDLPTGSLSARLGVTSADAGGTDLVGALEWSHELPRGGLDVRLERTVESDGPTDSVQDTVFSISLDQEVNAVSSLGLAFSHEISVAPAERIEQTELAATYRYRLTEDWGLDSGVRYRVRDDADGRSKSPDVFVALSRSFDFRP